MFARWVCRHHLVVCAAEADSFLHIRSRRATERWWPSVLSAMEFFPWSLGWSNTFWVHCTAKKCLLLQFVYQLWKWIFSLAPRVSLQWLRRERRAWPSREEASMWEWVQGAKTEDREVPCQSSNSWRDISQPNHRMINVQADQTRVIAKKLIAINKLDRSWWSSAGTPWDSTKRAWPSKTFLEEVEPVLSFSLATEATDCPPILLSHSPDRSYPPSGAEHWSWTRNKSRGSLCLCSADWGYSIRASSHCPCCEADSHLDIICRPHWVLQTALGGSRCWQAHLHFALGAGACSSEIIFSWQHFCLAHWGCWMSTEILNQWFNLWMIEDDKRSGLHAQKPVDV